jgi:hypothetical protein
MTSTTANSTAPLPNDYVVELLSETGKRHRLIGWGSDIDAARRCYDDTSKEYPHTWGKMRQGKQTIALRIPEAFVHEARRRKH